MPVGLVAQSPADDLPDPMRRDLPPKVLGAVFELIQSGCLRCKRCPFVVERELARWQVERLLWAITSQCGRQAGTQEGVRNYQSRDIPANVFGSVREGRFSASHSREIPRIQNEFAGLIL